MPLREDPLLKRLRGAKKPEPATLEAARACSFAIVPLLIAFTCDMSCLNEGISELSAGNECGTNGCCPDEDPADKDDFLPIEIGATLLLLLLLLDTVLSVLSVLFFASTLFLDLASLLLFVDKAACPLSRSDLSQIVKVNESNSLVLEFVHLVLN